MNNKQLQENIVEMIYQYMTTFEEMWLYFKLRIKYLKIYILNITLKTHWTPIGHVKLLSEHGNSDTLCKLCWTHTVHGQNIEDPWTNRYIDI